MEVPQTSHWFPTFLVEGVVSGVLHLPLESLCSLQKPRGDREVSKSNNLCLKWPMTFHTQCWGLTAQGGSAFAGFWDPAERIPPEGNESQIEYQ